jgi:hypothetical protein
MPLLQISVASSMLVQRCANCGTVNWIQLGTLVLGTAVGGRINKDAILLPPCVCSAQEILVRNWDVTPPAFRDTAHCEQRAAVNALALYLKSKGQQNTLAKSLQDQETANPAEIMDLADAAYLRVVANVPGEAQWNATVAAQRGTQLVSIKYGS